MKKPDSVDVLIMKGWFEDWRFIGGLQKGSTTIQNSFNSDCHFFLTTPIFKFAPDISQWS